MKAGKHMDDAPELTSITRRRTIRPLAAAWTLVLVTLGTGFIWLTFSNDIDPALETAQQMTAPDTNGEPDPASTEPGQDLDLDGTQAETQVAGNPPSSPETADDATQDVPQPQGQDTENTSDTENTPAPEVALVRAPIAGLVIKGANGLLPVLGPDSLVAWKAYARPQDMSDERPKIALLVTGIGLNSRATELAIKQLPGQVDMGFSPYGRDLQQWMNTSRQYGHEGFLMIPTEPLKYPENDPGPHTLLTGASTRDNLKKLDWVLSQVAGYVGVINHMGSKFTSSEKDILPILNDLNDRGLMFLDARSTRFTVAAKLARRISMPRAFNNLFLDNTVSSTEIAQNLAKLENTARTYGTAIGVARAFPLTIQEIKLWAKDLGDRGFQLVPITAVANHQPIR